MKDVSILIISYNTKELTLACLKSVFEQTRDISYEVIVVDNCSTDGSALAIEKEFCEACLIKSDENLGFAAANNLAAQKAQGKYILLLNPDTVVLDEAIQKLYKFATKFPDNQVYGGRTLFDDLSLNPTSCWRRQTLWGLTCYAFGLNTAFKANRLFNPEGYGGWKRNSIREVDIVTGCFLLIEKKLWDDLRGFDQAFFMYGEDADLCLRAKKLGARPIINSHVSIIHYGGASEKIRADKLIRLFKARQAIIIRHWKPLKRNLGLMMFCFGVRIRTVAAKLLHFLFPKKYQSTAENWREIWERRKEWHKPGL